MVHHSESLGLVLVDRNTVAVGPGDITLSFGAYPAEARAVGGYRKVGSTKADRRARKGGGAGGP